MMHVSNNPYKIIEDLSYADRIRGKRRVVKPPTEEEIKRTRDIFERSGCKKEILPAYTKIDVIDWPVQSEKVEMREVMEGYYSGKVSTEEIKGFFTEYCSVMYARGEKAILNVYETFLDESYAAAVATCFEKGKAIACKEGKDCEYMAYYDAAYYYKAEEARTALQEAAKEYGAKYGVEVDTAKREADFQRLYPTGKPDFHDKWDYMARCVYYAGGIVDKAAVPPRDFSCFFKRGEDNGRKENLLIISGKNWSERMDVPFRDPSVGDKGIHYFYLADLFRVDGSRAEDYKWYNDFLNKLYINRTSPGLVIKRR